MKIRHFLYNTFLVEDKSIKIAIDPGQNLWLFKLSSLIPKREWKTITHVLVTHGDPDHYWQADRIAIEANAPLIMNQAMVKHTEQGLKILAPRRDGIRFTSFDGTVTSIEVGESIELDGVKIQGIKTQHGPIEFKLFGIRQQKIPGPNERAGFGSIGYQFQLGQHSVLNVGDSLLRKEWAGLNPDIAMLPIGGLGNGIWTMDVAEALEAVKIISPGLVIPCHYSAPFLWHKKFAIADDQLFQREVENMGIDCQIMRSGEEIEI
jgi:L-ascorbate metabolism protein UlaG (beta-lactamase superfamily)